MPMLVAEKHSTVLRRTLASNEITFDGKWVRGVESKIEILVQETKRMQ